MPPGTVEMISHHLRSLDRAARYQLVADLWAARDFKIATAGPVVEARKTDRSVRVHVGPYQGTPTNVDIVVDVTDRSSVTNGVRVVDARDLAEMLVYALDPETRLALCERHLGGPPSNLRPPIHTRLRDRFDRARTAIPAIVVATLVLATLLLVAGTVTVGNPPAPAAMTATESAETTTVGPGSQSSLPTATGEVAIPPPSYPTPPPGGFLNGSIDIDESAIHVGTS